MIWHILLWLASIGNNFSSLCKYATSRASIEFIGRGEKKEAPYTE